MLCCLIAKEKDHIRFNKLKEMIKDLDTETNKSTLELLDEYTEDIVKSGNKEFCLESINIHEEYIVYNAQRLCRLDELYTINLATKYYNVNSRLGLPGDFAKEYKYKTYKVKFENPEKVIDATKNLYLDECEQVIDIAIAKDINSEIYNNVLRNLKINKLEEALAKCSNKQEENNAISQFINNYIEVKEDEKSLIIKVDTLDILENKTKSEIDFKSNLIKIPIEIIKNEAKNFYSEIKQYAGNKEFLFRNPSLRKFYDKDTKNINEYITVKQSEIKGKQIDIAFNKVKVKIILSLLKKEKVQFELNIECKESVG